MTLRSQYPDRGSALVITLMMLVLLTVIILASLVTAQSSRQSSNSIMDNFTASQFAQHGVNQAVSLLQYAAGAADAKWASQPGRIEKILTSGSSELIDLHSGAAVAGKESVNLNAPMLQNPLEGTIAYDPAVKMNLSWIYVRADGTYSQDATYDAANKVVGRYAFWTDDNASRININTAWTEDAVKNTASIAHPSRIPLLEAYPELTEEDIETIHDYRAAGGFFNSPLDILKSFGADSNTRAIPVRKSKFWTTHINADPSSDLTSFGLPKIVLTTKPERAKAKDGTQLPYIDVSTSAAIDATKAMIRSYLSQANWGDGLEGSLQAKYYNGTSGLLDMIALNIMEYVRCRESSDEIIKPMRHGIGSTGKVFAGATRRFRMVEIGFWRSSTVPNNGRIYFVLTLPKNAGLQSYQMNGWRAHVINSSRVVEQDIYLPNTTLVAGDYVLVTWHLPKAIVSTGAVYQKHLQFKIGTDMFDIYPSGQQAYFELYDFPVTESAPSSSDPLRPADESLIQTIKIGDPFLGGTKDDWSAPGPNRFADLADKAKMRAHVGLGTAPTDYELGQDLDADGNVTDEGLILPAPAGSPGNPRGYVESLAELGRIHTGISTVPDTPSVPWRTLRLQPRHPNSTAYLDSVPDWAILDAFTLPIIPSNAAGSLPERPSGRSGHVNINAGLAPFADVLRTEGVQALLNVNDRFTETERASAVTSIINRKLANSQIAEGKSPNADLLRYPGSIVELEGVSDGGEATEERLSGLIDLATTKGSVFTIYTIGQTVTQNASGKITPLSESSQMTMIERYQDASDNQIKFRTIFNKPLRN